MYKFKKQDTDSFVATEPTKPGTTDTFKSAIGSSSSTNSDLTSQTTAVDS